MKVLRKAFKQELDEQVAKFVNSIDADRKLIDADIKGSLAHVQMLGQVGLISKSDLDAICRGLTELKDAYDKGELRLQADFEDVHMNVEKQLEAKIGRAASRLHTGRSRNDQVALDTRLYTVSLIENIKSEIAALQMKLIEKGKEHFEVVMPGYTHLQRAQPVLFAHALHAFVEMLERDYDRLSDCFKRTAVSPLGAAALAGSSLMLNPSLSAELAGFKNVFSNSLDAVSDRDFLVEFISVCSIASMHLSQMAETMIIWATSEFAFLSFADTVTTASSLMPNKKNPDPIEIVRGKTGSITGDLVNVLLTLKALPLGYNRDLQELKPALIHAADTLTDCLKVMSVVVDAMSVNSENMLEAASDSFLAATDLAEYLVRKGLAFRQAHETVAELVAYARESGKTLSDLSLDEVKHFSPLFDLDILQLFDPVASVGLKQSHGGSSYDSVSKALQLSSSRVKSRCSNKQLDG